MFCIYLYIGLWHYLKNKTLKMRPGSKILLALLSMLGFSSCFPFWDRDGGKSGDDGDEVAMYGVIRSEYIVKGAVRDADNEPVEGIKVYFKFISAPEVVVGPASTLTDGRFVSNPFYLRTAGIKVTAVDEDGPDNGGEFQTAEKIISPDDANWQLSEEDYWYTEVEFMLEPVKNDSNENDE